MHKQAPTLGRLLVMAGFALSCFGLLLYLWLAFGGPIPLKPNGYRFSTSFAEGTQLAKEADVRISGVPVGKVKSFQVQRNGRSRTVIELARRYAPIPRDSRAILRQKTLLGETYIELTPGRREHGMLPEGGALPASAVSRSVALDQVFRALDVPTRRAFDTWMQSLAVATRGRGRDISDALARLAPFARDTNTLALLLDAQQPEVRRVVSHTGDVLSALSQRDGQLSGLITNSNLVFAATAARSRELGRAFIALPTFEHELSRTVSSLSRFSARANPLVTQLRPAARELSPTLTDVSALAPDLKGLFRDLNPLIDASRSGLPALARFLDELHPVLSELDPVLRELNPILNFVGQYRRELNSFFANVVASTQAADVPSGSRTPIHYLRTTNPINPENLAVYPRRIGSNRPNPYQFPGAFDQLARGLAQYESRHCASGVPTVAPGPPGLISEPLRQQIQQFAFGVNGSVPAPPCRQQGNFAEGGQITQYPHIAQAPSGSARARLRR